MSWLDGTIRVRVPATSANLGPGFDALGLALTLHDDIEASVSDGGLSIAISGEGEALAQAGEDHLVIKAMRAAFGAMGGQPPGIGLRCVNRIPHGRGLGSSAAAVVGGILAARALHTSGHAALPDAALLDLATAMEGHPDNVAACLAGGLTIAWTDSGHAQMLRLTPSAEITPVVCIAEEPVRTDVARQALPAMVPHRDAAANAARSALLIAALTQDGQAAGYSGIWPPSGSNGQSAAGSVLLAATQDWLHQDYRAQAMPQTHALVRALRAAGIAAVVSGAGPSVLALLGGRDRPDYRGCLDRLGSIVRETGNAWHVSSLDVERQGARVLRPEPVPGS